MPALRDESLPIRADSDIVLVRQAARSWSIDAGFSLVEQTKMVTAASELARNTLAYGGGGTVRLEALEEHGRRGFRMTFEDRGPGIPDLERALRDGFSTGKGLGLGLSGSRRLVNEFSIESQPGQGTRVVIARWR